MSTCPPLTGRHDGKAEDIFRARAPRSRGQRRVAGVWLSSHWLWLFCQPQGGQVMNSNRRSSIFSRRPRPWRARSRASTPMPLGIPGRQRALKIKRAVRFPFLDFSTLEKRKAACEAEIEVNRPFAPAIYRGVVRDHARGRRRARDRRRRRAGRMGGRDAPLRRDHDARPSGRARRASTIALADALARAVAAAHAAAPVGRRRLGRSA